MKTLIIGSIRLTKNHLASRFLKNDFKKLKFTDNRVSLKKTI